MVFSSFMSAVEYRSREFGDGNSPEAVALIAGFTGKIVDFEQAARHLEASGKDVIAYEYDNDVFLAGEGAILPELIKDLSADFLSRTKDHEKHRYAGASLGGGIGWNMQKDCSNAEPGLFAAIGADVAHLVMGNRVFRKVVKAFHKVDTRKQFERNGYTKADLFAEWEHLHTPPITGFVVALGGLDYMIRRREVMPKFREWQEDIDISIIVQRKLGHAGIIKWFAANTPVMLELADSKS